MSSVTAMLARVQKLEQARQAPMSPIAGICGSFANFKAEVRAKIEANVLDREFLLVLVAVKRWDDNWMRNA